MSLYRSFVSSFIGYIGSAEATKESSLTTLDQYYVVRDTDHQSKGQVVVSTSNSDYEADKLSSDQLHYRAQRAQQEFFQRYQAA